MLRNVFSRVQVLESDSITTYVRLSVCQHRVKFGWAGRDYSKIDADQQKWEQSRCSFSLWNLSRFLPATLASINDVMLKIKFRTLLTCFLELYFPPRDDDGGVKRKDLFLQLHWFQNGIWYVISRHVMINRRSKKEHVIAFAVFNR